MVNETVRGNVSNTTVRASAEKELNENVGIVSEMHYHDELELLPFETVIQRITGDGARDTLIAPLWSVKKFDVINGVDREMNRRNSFQGDKFFG